MCVLCLRVCLCVSCSIHMSVCHVLFIYVGVVIYNVCCVHVCMYMYCDLYTCVCQVLCISVCVVIYVCVCVIIYIYVCVSRTRNVCVYFYMCVSVYCDLCRIGLADQATILSQTCTNTRSVLSSRHTQGYLCAICGW